MQNFVKRSSLFLDCRFGAINILWTVIAFVVAITIAILCLICDQDLIPWPNAIRFSAILLWICILTTSASVVAVSFVVSLILFAVSLVCSIADTYALQLDNYALPLCLSVAIGNSIAVRTSWQRARRSPSESSIHRSLLSSIERSLLYVVYTTSSLVLLVCAPALQDPQRLPSCILTAMLIVISNICAFLFTLSLLLCRTNAHVQKFPPPQLRPLIAFVGEKLVYVAHFACTYSQKVMLTMKLPLFVTFLVFLISFAGYGVYTTFIAPSNVNPVQTLSSSGRFVLAWIILVNIASFFVLHRSILYTLAACALVAAPVLFFHLYMKLTTWNCTLSQSQLMTLASFSLDATLRFCVSFKQSRKRKHTSRIFNALEMAFAQIVIPRLAICGVELSAIAFRENDQTTLLSLLFSAFVSLVFGTATMLVLGDLVSSRGVLTVVTSHSSLHASRYSTHFLHDTSAVNTRKCSSQPLPMQKKSVPAQFVYGECRKTSMMNLRQARIQQEWIEQLTKRQSLDSVCPPRFLQSTELTHSLDDMRKSLDRSQLTLNLVSPLCRQYENKRPSH